MIFREGRGKWLFVEKNRLAAGKPAVVVKDGDRPLFRFRRALLLGPSIMEQRPDGTVWLYTEDAVEGRREEEERAEEAG